MDEATIFAALALRARELGIDPETDANVYRRLGQAAQKAAIELRESGSTEVSLPFLAATASGPIHLTLRLPDGANGATPRLDPRVKLS